LRNFGVLAGIYIHIPFCKQKCTYCDFHFSTSFSGYRQEMIRCIARELKQRSRYLKNKRIDTIYFGGGTPSLLLHEELKLLKQVVCENFDVYQNVEITLESNPDDITEETLKMWKEIGINRLSIGLQSFKKEDLNWMNRAHTVVESMECVTLAQNAGFKNLSADLIYGLPDLTLGEWKAQLQQLIDLNVPHISAYCLTIEKNTAVHNWVSKGRFIPQTDEQQSKQFMELVEVLEANGYIQYEISNFSKPGLESRHNSNYWKGEWYLGVGPSAHSFNGDSRRWNVSNNQKYIDSINTEKEYYTSEKLSIHDRFNEKLLIGLRTNYGVNLEELSEIAELSDKFTKQCEGHIENGWAEREGDNLFLTKEGKLRADYIASDLFLEQ